MGIQINGQTDTISAIDGGITVGTDLTVPGVLTYDDVTNIDSVGVITARNGLNVTGGSVGIGTDNANVDLHLHDSSLTRIQFTDDSTGAAAGDGVIMGLNGDDNFFINNRETSKEILLFTEDSERLRITGIGSVGIGQNDPDTLLHLTKNNADPYNTPVTLLKLHNGGGNQGSTSRIELKTGAATCYIENKIGGPNSNSGADLVFATPSSATVGTERMRIHSDGVIQTFNHAECLAWKNNKSVTGGDGTTHELGVDGFIFNRGGYTITSENIVVPKTGTYRCIIRWEGMITNSAYSIRAIKCVPRIGNVVSGTYTDHWHCVAACPSSNTHWSFRDMYYLDMNANDQVDALMTWYPYASRTELIDVSISLFYIG